MIRATVKVEFSRAELPVTDADVRRRMTLLLELDRGDKILSLTIKTRAYMQREQRFVFEGVAQIAEESADTESNRLKVQPIGQPGGPKTGWWQRSAEQ